MLKPLFPLAILPILLNAAPPPIEGSYSQTNDLQLNQEVIPAGENQKLVRYAQEFHRIHKQQQEANEQTLDTDETVWRGMHAKGHGCFHGTLSVTAVDRTLQEGIFSSQRHYPVVARFSNGSGRFQPDSKRDLRGLALKVSDVDGVPLISDRWEQGTQDFLMTNAPRHHAKDIDELMGFVKAMAGGVFDKAKFFATHPFVLTTLLHQTSRKIHSLRAESYWSRAAFSWGDHLTVKYLAEPCKEIIPTPALSPNNSQYLTEELAKGIETAEVCFRFMVQKQENAQTEPIEDHRTLWETPAHEVGRIEFEPQIADFSEACESLQFNPWNGIQAHRPLGNFNRARRYIYERAQEFRHTGE